MLSRAGPRLMDGYVTPGGPTPHRLQMNRRLLIIWAASLELCFGCLAISLYTEFHTHRWQWGAKSYLEASEHTRELILSGGELSFRCADDWHTPAPAPSWQESESFDYNVQLGVFRFYRLREIWYHGEPPSGGLSQQQRVELPHFSYGRHGWDISFMTAAFVFLVPILATLLIALRVLLRARRAKGLCRNCDYDLRGTPERCPECGLVVESSKKGVSAGVT
jgi:hypothetical protein